MQYLLQIRSWQHKLKMPEIPKIVRERLQRPNTSSATHPDPNVLTAFAEQLLPRAERATVLEHLSLCADCREILALALPAFEPAQVAVGKTSQTWFAWPRIRWAFASAGFIAVALIGFLVYGHRSQSVRMAKNTEAPAAMQTYQEPEPPPQTQKAADEPSSQSESAKNSTRLMALEKDKKAPASLPEAAVQARNYSNPGTPAAVSHGPRQMNQWQQQSRNAQQVPGPAPSLNAPTKQQASAGTSLVPRTSTDAVQIQTQAAQGELKAETADSLVASNRVSAQPSASDMEVSRAKSAPAAPAPVPSRIQVDSRALLASRVTPTWTITSGRLQRSFDQGATWQDVNVNPSLNSGGNLELTVARNVSKASQKRDKQEQSSPVVFRAVAANGTEVWVGGTSAALYHSSDAGAHWLRVIPSSANAALTGDILTLDFPDAQNGRISTSTSEIWTTSDNGQTWQKQ